MRNYWIRIAMGALAIFAVGMVGITLVRRSISGVREVAEGTGPISLPVVFVPFKLDGQKLGSINRIVLHRVAPKQVSSVELGIKLSDSVLAHGLGGCRLVANFETQHDSGDVAVGPGHLSSGVFSCLHGSDSIPQFQEFGHAVFQPGNVSVPLLLPNDIVDDLKEGDPRSRDFGPGYEDSVEAAVEAAADSIAQAAEAQAEQAASKVARTQRLIDSLRREGMRRADSTQRAVSRVADPVPAR